MPCLSVTALRKLPFVHHLSSSLTHYLSVQPTHVKTTPALLFLLITVSGSQVHADSMSALIAQKNAQPELAVPAARISTRSSIQRAPSSYQAPTANYSAAVTNYPITKSSTKNAPTVRYPNNNARYTISEPIANNAYNHNSQPTRTAVQPTVNTNYRYPIVQRKTPSVLPAFLSNSYDNVDSKYLPLLSNAEVYSSSAAREVMSTARAMSLNERTIIQGGCWDYLNAVFNRAGVTKNTVHNGVYEQGPYASSNEIEVGDWLYYINHGYNDIEHSGLFVGWVDESAKQALILSYAGENRQEPARYRVYDLSHVYQIMRPVA